MPTTVTPTTTPPSPTVTPVGGGVTCSLDWWWDCCWWWEQVSAPHLNSRDITHTLVLQHQRGRTDSTAADTDRHIHHSPAHPTDSHFLPAVHTTAAHNHSHPCPFGKAFHGRDGRDGLPGPPGPPGPPGIPGAAGTPGVAAIDLRYVSHPLQTLHITQHVHPHHHPLRLSLLLVEE